MKLDRRPEIYLKKKINDLILTEDTLYRFIAVWTGMLNKIKTLLLWKQCRDIWNPTIIVYVELSMW